MNKDLTTEIRKKIRQIEICTRRLLNGSLVGDSRSALKGSGFEFDQIREYQLGDDIRCIDWQGSARTNSLLVKQYREERNRTIVLAVDVSASGRFSSSEQLRCEIMANIAAVLALVADYGKDAVGLILFSDQIELFISPGKGTSHIQAIMRALYSHRPRNTKTSLTCVLQHLMAITVRDGLALIISDFIDHHVTYEKPLRSVAKKYDLIALRCLDVYEHTLPGVGFVTVEDAEDGQRYTLDMRSRARGALSNFLAQRVTAQHKLFKKYGIDCVDIALHKPFIGDLIRFFRRRMMY